MVLLSPTVSATKAISMLLLMTAGPFVHIEAKEQEAGSRHLRTNTKRELSSTSESSGVAAATVVAAVVTDEIGDQRCTASDTAKYEEFFHGQWNTRPLAGGTKCCPHVDGSKKITMQIMSQDCPELDEDSGILFDVPSSDIANEGWTQCYSGTYEDALTDSDIVDACTAGTKIMYGCKPDSSPSTWTLIGYGNKDKALASMDIEFDGYGSPVEPVVGTMDGNVQWYNTGFAIGFAHKDDALDLNSCDYRPSGRLDRRLCWHENRVNLGGYRCGATTGLNSATNWERAVWVK